MTRTRPHRQLVLVLLATLAACSSTGGSFAGDAPATLKVGVVTKVAVDGLVGWAGDRGILRQKLAPVGFGGVEFSTFPTGPALNAALTSRSVDVVVMGDTPALQLRSNDYPSRLIAISGIDGDDWLIGRRSGPTTLDGLIGKKASAAPGTAPERYLLGLLQQEGLSSAITISNLQTNDAATALRADQIDAFVASGPMAATFEADGYPVIDRASQHTGLSTTTVNVASQELLDAHPGFATAWGAALTEAAAAAKADPGGFASFNATADKVSVSIAQVATPLAGVPVEPFSPDGVQQLQGAYDFLLAQGSIKNPYDLNSWFDRG